MSTSSPQPDKFQREIDDIIRLAEKRLERQSPTYRVQRQVNRIQRRWGGVPSITLPDPEVLAGVGLAALFLTFLLGLPRLIGLAVPGLGFVSVLLQGIGFGLLAAAILLSLVRSRRRGGTRTWRGDPVRYDSPYGASNITRRIRRLFRGR
ncbi:MAG: hypothetical protein HYX52_03105 [Chloroflexi bacterium]|nr:hypothetical protein [Chloroflexota bacterium]